MSIGANFDSANLSRVKPLKSNLLDSVNTPDDLKKISIEEIPYLCDEIRRFLINSVTKTGGHLGSNLGIVEITTALHYVFDFLEDRLIFDVSHQSYVHKILTGRKNKFNTLRKFNGLSGFTNKDESIYDNFTLGHAGTSISLALGLAEAFDKSKKDNTAVVLIGDASISSGMPFEALNHIGQTKKNVLIILNDNEMSIAPTVGSLSKYLTKSRTNPEYISLKEKIATALRKIPLIGNVLYRLVGNIKEDIKHLLVPRNLFTDLSIPYYGPVDGHDVTYLIKILKDIKKIKGPKLLHILTTKGKGMSNLNDDPTRFHSAPEITASYQKTAYYEEKAKITYTDIFSETIVNIAKKNEKIVAITAAMKDGTGLVEFQKNFPDRFYDVGICEQHAIGLASGLATGGNKPVCAIYSTFIQRAYDQVFQEICLQNVPVILALDRAGIVGGDGPTHNGVFDIAFLRTLPNIVLCSPKDGYEFRNMLEFLTKINTPSAIRYPKKTTTMESISDNDQKIELGKGEILMENDKAKLSIFAYGSMVEIAYDVVKILTEQGLESNLINMRFVKPIDKELIVRFANKKIPIITLEEHSILGGFGSAILEVLSNEKINIPPIKIIGIPDKFIEHGNRNDILKSIGLEPISLSARIKQLIESLWIVLLD